MLSGAVHKKEVTNITVRHGSILVMGLLIENLHACMYATCVTGTDNPHFCRVVHNL